MPLVSSPALGFGEVLVATRACAQAMMAVRLALTKSASMARTVPSGRPGSKPGLASGAARDDLDAGLVSGIGDRVWEDLNANGTRDEGEGAPQGVTVDVTLERRTRRGWTVRLGRSSAPSISGGRGPRDGLERALEPPEIGGDGALQGL